MKPTQKPKAGEVWLPRNKRTEELGGYCHEATVERVSTRGVEFVTRPQPTAYTWPTARFVASFKPAATTEAP